MPDGLDVIHIDVDPWEIGKNYAAAVGIQGDPKATLPELCEAVRRHSTKNGHPQAAKRREAAVAANMAERAELDDKARQSANLAPMAPLALVHAVAQATPPGATIVDETISSGSGVRTFFKCEDAKSYFGLRGGGIGWGLPAAIGVKLALPQRPVVALIGDGSAMYTCQGLWTAAHDSVPVVFVIFNNASYRILKQRTLGLKGFSAEDDVYVGMDLDKPLIDHVGLAKSFGVPGERIEKVSEVGAAMGRGLASGGPYLIDARIDPHFK
jgi:benzoylformate decarboxylase